MLKINNIERLELLYNIKGHMFAYNDMLYFSCKYCDGHIDVEEKCISDEEKIIKDLLE